MLICAQGSPAGLDFCAPLGRLCSIVFRSAASLVAVCLFSLHAVASPSITLPPGFEVHPFVSGLHTNTSMVWLPGGRMLCNELAVVSYPLGGATGRIRVVESGGVLLPQALYETSVDPGNGLSGLALDPGFESNRWLYVYVALPGNETHELRRLTVAPDFASVSEEITLASLPAPAPASSWHGQTNMEFGPDGLLWVNLGDGAYETASPELEVPPPQDPASLFGKVFRLDVHALPLDLSSPEALIVASGFRNPFGLAVHPTLGTVWVTENGPLVDDELNVIVPGGNYGWPLLTGSQSSPGYIAPARNYPQVIAPVDAAFYTGAQFPATYAGNLFFGDFIRGGLRRVVLGGPNLDVYVSEDLWFDNRPFGHLTSVAVAPDGTLHFGAQAVPYSTGPDTTIHRITFVSEPAGLALR